MREKGTSKRNNVYIIIKVTSAVAEENPVPSAITTTTAIIIY